MSSIKYININGNQSNEAQSSVILNGDRWWQSTTIGNSDCSFNPRAPNCFPENTSWWPTLCNDRDVNNHPRWERYRAKQHKLRQWFVGLRFIFICYFHSHLIFMCLLIYLFIFVTINLYHCKERKKVKTQTVREWFLFVCIMECIILRLIECICLNLFNSSTVQHLHR